MSCEQMERLVLLSRDGGLTPRQEGELRDHARSCVRCAGMVRSFDKVGQALRERPELQPRADLFERALSDWESRPAFAYRRQLIWSAGLASAAVLALVIGVALRSHLHPDTAPVNLVSRTVEPPKSGGRGNSDSHNDPSRIVDRNRPPVRERVVDKSQPTLVHEMPALDKRTADDLGFLNPDPVRSVMGWGTFKPDEAEAARAMIDRTIRMGDDFVYVPWPQLASADATPEQRIRILAAAEIYYKQQKEIVDARLSRNVSLSAKGLAFADICRELKEKTGIELHVGRAAADDKATILCEDRPLREIMRQISLVFGFSWQRNGDEGSYSYVLIQPLKAQLAEEELRNKDIDAALLALDQSMVGKAASHGAQAYQQLSPAERMALRAGKELQFSTDKELPAGFPAAWSKGLLQTFDGTGTPDGTFYPSTTPGFSAAVTLSLVTSELGQVTLECQSSVHGPGLGLAKMATLGMGRSPSAARPDNRAANKGLEFDPAFRREISLAPKACSKADFMTAYDLDFTRGRHIEDDIQAGGMMIDEHVSSSDVWEAVHVKTGMPIVADYFTHIYPVGEFKMERATLYDALCRAGDSLGVHWKKDGEYIQVRSVAFFWDKIKEVPNRLLDRWQADSARSTGLPLDDLLEMASLTDQQLDSTVVGKGVKHCRDLMEWTIVSSPEYTGMRRKYDTVRPMARFLAGLPKGFREQAQGKDGLRANALPSVHQDALSKIVPPYNKPTTYDGMRIRIEYVPARRYTWRPLVDSREEAMKLMNNPSPLAVGKTAEEALTEARKIYPNATIDSVHRSYGQLALSFMFADGSSVAIGKRPPSWRIPQ